MRWIVGGLLFLLAACASTTTETIRFSAWQQEITVRIMSTDAVYAWCVTALGLPENTIGCSYWVKGDKTRCVITLPRVTPTWLVFHELLDRCRDRDTEPYSPRIA